MAAEAPAVVVHGLAHVRIALAAGRAFTLLSAPGAGVSLGVGWWRALAEAAGGMDDILDCGVDGGCALLALRCGQRRLVLRGAFAGTLGDIARDRGAVVLAAPPAALDLGRRGAARRLGGWLG